MIDASKSPLPAWKRYVIASLLTVLIAVAGYVVWTKELHHTSTSASPTTSAVVTNPAPKHAPVAPSTTIPGGIAVSARNPFGP